MSKLQKALAWMTAQIAAGVEYPTAQYRATVKFNVDADQLQDAYDAI